MKDVAHFTSAREAVEEMILAGARFRTLTRSENSQSWFVYELTPGGDRARCRAILAAAKARPPAFWNAFRCEVMHLAEAPDAETGGAA